MHDFFKSRQTLEMKLFKCAVAAVLTASVCHAQGASPRTGITLPAASLARYVGTYELAPRINVMITLTGSQLVAQLSGQSRLPIFPQSETLFGKHILD
jgi:hypothetical protein